MAEPLSLSPFRQEPPNKTLPAKQEGGEQQAAEQQEAEQQKAFAKRRAEPPRPPTLSASAARAEGERRMHLEEREAVERRSLWRGLILLALLVLLLSCWRAGWGRAFAPGWWHQW